MGPSPRKRSAPAPTRGRHHHRRVPPRTHNSTTRKDPQVQAHPQLPHVPRPSPQCSAYGKQDTVCDRPAHNSAARKAPQLQAHPQLPHVPRPSPQCSAYGKQDSVRDEPEDIPRGTSHPCWARQHHYSQRTCALPTYVASPLAPFGASSHYSPSNRWCKIHNHGVHAGTGAAEHDT